MVWPDDDALFPIDSGSVDINPTAVYDLIQLLWGTSSEQLPR